MTPKAHPVSPTSSSGENAIHYPSEAHSENEKSILAAYKALPPQDPSVLRWTLQVLDPRMPSPVVLSGTKVMNLVLKVTIILTSMIIGSSVIAGLYYRYLYEEGYDLTWSPEYCGPVVQFILRASKQFRAIQAAQTLFVTPDAPFMESIMYVILPWLVLPTMLWSDIQALLPAFDAASAHDMGPVVLSFALLRWSRALSKSGLLAAMLLYVLTHMIDPSLNVVFFAFALLGALSSVLKKRSAFTCDKTIDDDLYTATCVQQTYRPMRSKGRRAVQVFCNGFPVVLGMSMLILSFIIFPPHLGDSLYPHLDVLRFKKYAFLRSKRLQVLFFSSAVGRYFQGARDLILTLIFDRNLKKITLSVLKEFSAWQVLIGIACACGDTFSSDLGQCFRRSIVRTPVIPLKPIRAGTQGGISVMGSICSMIGGILMALVWKATRYQRGQPLPYDDAILFGFACLAGLVSSYLDSILGWFLQPSAADVFGVIWDDRMASLCVGLDYLDVLKPEPLPEDIKKLVDSVRAFSQRSKRMPIVLNPLQSEQDSSVDEMIPISEALRYRLVNHSTLLKPCTIVLDNHSVNFLAPLLTLMLINSIHPFIG